MTPQEIIEKSVIGKLVSIELEETGEPENPKIFVKVPPPRKIRQLFIKYLPSFQDADKQDAKRQEIEEIQKNLERSEKLVDFAMDWLNYAVSHTWGGDSKDIEILRKVFELQERFAISFGVGCCELSVRVINGDEESKKNLSPSPSGTKRKGGQPAAPSV